MMIYVTDLQDLRRRIEENPVPGREIPPLSDIKALGKELEYRLSVHAPSLKISQNSKGLFTITRLRSLRLRAKIQKDNGITKSRCSRHIKNTRKRQGPKIQGARKFKRGPGRPRKL